MPNERRATRHERLAAIVANHRCSMPDRRTKLLFLAPDDRTPRFAAVTSASRSEPADLAAAGCRLHVADSVWVLGILLDRERDAGRFAHGRVWDLDAAWDSLGNFDPRYSSQAAAETDVFPVRVPGRQRIYLFDHPQDAEDFAYAVRDRGEAAELSDEDTLYHRRGAELLIGFEASATKARTLFEVDPERDRPTQSKRGRRAA
jgi:hypothetical protein